MGFTFLATADLHLGKSSAGSELPENRRSSAINWQRMVDYAIQHRVDAVLLAGDVVDQDNRFFEARSALARGFGALNEASIPVVLVAGNHDFQVLPELLRNYSFENVHFLGEGGRWSAKTLEFAKGSVQFVGWSFASRFQRENPMEEFDANLISPDLPVIGLLHGDFGLVDSVYAPLSEATLATSDVKAWVLGHIHKPQVLSQSPLIFYPGSPQALSAKESGIHGPYLLKLDGNQPTAEQIAMSAVQFETLPVDVTLVTSALELNSAISEAIESFLDENAPSELEELVVDLAFTGMRDNIAEIDDWSVGLRPDKFGSVLCTIRKFENRCRVKIVDLAALADEPSPAGVLATAILDLEKSRDSEFLSGLRNEILAQISHVTQSRVYRPLRKTSEELFFDDDAVNELLLLECNKLLSALMVTREAQ